MGQSRIITDKLRSYAAAKAEVQSSVEHHRQRRLNNRADNLYQPTGKGGVGCAASSHPDTPSGSSVFGVIASFFRAGQHLIADKNYREIMRRRFTQWGDIVGLQPAI
jgi:putative transposase